MMTCPSGSAKICYATGVGTCNITKRGIERVCVCSVCERERGNERGNKGRAGFEHEGTKSEKAGVMAHDVTTQRESYARFDAEKQALEIHNVMREAYQLSQPQ